MLHRNKSRIMKYRSLDEAFESFQRFDNVVYMCKVTRKAYDNPFQPRKNLLDTKGFLEKDELLEYLYLSDKITDLQRK